MTNRFKFRAWNKLRNEMVNEDGMEFGAGEDKETLHPCVGFWGEFIMFNLEDNQSNCLPDEDQVALMQCTGLTDDNDALVYEGDIVLVLDRWVDPEKHIIKTKVIFERGCFWLETFYKMNKYDGEVYIDYISIYKSYGRDKFEVIGNIYENPELLKESLSYQLMEQIAIKNKQRIKIKKPFQRFNELLQIKKENNLNDIQVDELISAFKKIGVKIPFSINRKLVIN